MSSFIVWMVHLQLNRQASLTVTYKQKKCTVCCKYVAGLCLNCLMCVCSLLIWVDGVLGNLSTPSSSVFIVAITVFSSITLVCIETWNNWLRGKWVLFAKYPLAAFGFAVVVHIIQPEISARSYCNFCDMLGQTNITFCFPVSLCVSLEQKQNTHKCAL